MHQRIRHAVEMPVHRDVIVDVDARGFHSPNWRCEAANGFSAGRSSCANSVARLPGRLQYGRLFSRTSSSAIAWFASSREKNLGLRRAAHDPALDYLNSDFRLGPVVSHQVQVVPISA